LTIEALKLQEQSDNGDEEHGGGFERQELWVMKSSEREI